MTELQALDAIITEQPEVAPVPYYFATKNGWYSNVPTLFGTAHIPADKWPKRLPEQKTLFYYSEEKVPGFIFDQALDFFRQVYRKHQTEATSYICRDSDGQYSLFIPKQYVTGASVNHKVEAGQMGDRSPVGTIHSHCMMSAFHSGTDEHDMGKMPGLHVTIGMVMSEEPEYAVAMAVGDTKFDIEPHDILDESITEDANGFNSAPEHWLNFVHANERAPWTGGIATTYSKTPSSKGYKYGKMRPVGFTPPSWWMDDEWQYYSPYQSSADKRQHTDDLDEEAHLATSKRWLLDEQRELAEMGYVLEFDIHFDPEKARDLMEQRQATNGDDTLPMFGGQP